MKFKHYSRCGKDDEPFNTFEKRKKKNKPLHSPVDERIEYQSHREHGFNCIQCGFPVAVEREQSGVVNRNHCPRCLYSRHVDEFKAGDRKSQCKSRMQPVGLTLKKTHKRYGQDTSGELMIIHHCGGCGKFSINRIAADDDAAVIYALFKRSVKLPPEWLTALALEGITLLGQADLTTVYSQLFGWQAILSEFESGSLHTPELNEVPETESSINLLE